jgi:hypothetical protein
MGIVPFGRTIDELSLLTYNIGPEQKLSFLPNSDKIDQDQPQPSPKPENKNYPIKQQRFHVGNPIFNCESADEDVLLGKTIEFIIGY